MLNDQPVRVFHYSLSTLRLMQEICYYSLLFVNARSSAFLFSSAEQASCDFWAKIFERPRYALLLFPPLDRLSISFLLNIQPPVPFFFSLYIFCAALHDLTITTIIGRCMQLKIASRLRTSRYKITQRYRCERMWHASQLRVRLRSSKLRVTCLRFLFFFLFP